MKQPALIICAYLLLLTGCSEPMAIPNIRSVKRKVGDTQQNGDAIRKDAAIAIARADATKNQVPLGDYNTAVCRTKQAWYVIFEPAAPNHNGALKEYIIDSYNGVLLNARQVSLGRPDRAEVKAENVFVPIELSRDEIINISNRDTIEAYQSLEPYNVITCELAETWLVVYELKDTGLVGGGPQYFIDKKTGDILSKIYYQ
ncbi:MAG TPA: hypothetical protein VNA19_14845 [Pyrinomonadaceae bacterium]|jgi:hypothetical protein|nr:hypothetical protein [Pyrinomonadaceae bacterium]